MYLLVPYQVQKCTYYQVQKCTTNRYHLTETIETETSLVLNRTYPKINLLEVI